MSHYYPPHIGGIEFVVRTQAEQLAARGHTVTVVTSRIAEGAHAAPAAGRHTPPNLHIQRVAAWNGLERWGIPYPWFAPNLLVQLARAIRQADVVHVHDAFYQSSFWAVVMAHWYRKPLVVTQHVGLVAHPQPLVRWLQQAVYATAGRFIWRSARTVLVLNTSVWQLVLRHGVPANQLYLTANSVDTDRFHPVADAAETAAIRRRFGLDARLPAVLFVGRLAPKKGYRLVLAAANPAYQLVFAGGHPARTAQAEFAQPGVQVLGPLPQADLADVYRAATVFVLPSQSEGFPLSLQEAMASGLPVITTDDPGYAPYELDAAAIRLLSQPTAQTVQAAIDEVLGNPSQAAAMAKYSRWYALERFAPASLIRELEAVYAQAGEAA